MEILRGLLPFVLLAACPIGMLIMMRGMHGGHGQREGHAASNMDPDPASDTRLAAMEREIARLRGELDAARGVETVGQGRNGGRG